MDNHLIAFGLVRPVVNQPVADLDRGIQHHDVSASIGDESSPHVRGVLVVGGEGLSVHAHTLALLGATASTPWPLRYSSSGLTDGTLIG